MNRLRTRRGASKSGKFLWHWREYENTHRYEPVARMGIDISAPRLAGEALVVVDENKYRVRILPIGTL